MESLKTDFVFQTDSALVHAMYEKENYTVSVDPNAKDKGICVLYFSSHDIYYPNTDEVFRKKIVERDSYEWYGTRIENVYKHIFIRDIKKQWYLHGINSRINTPEKLLEFLKKECQSYRIITVGSSAGGYAAVLYGSLLGAEKVFCFNGQFNLNMVLSRSSTFIDPLLFQLQNSEFRIYYDLKSFLNMTVPIHYFVSVDSNLDKEQFNYIKVAQQVKVIKFKTSHHGIPFPKACLPNVLSLSNEEIEQLIKYNHRPIIFSIRIIGLIPTFKGIWSQIVKKYFKKY